jgi:hypothetical protein
MINRKVSAPSRDPAVNPERRLRYTHRYDLGDIGIVRKLSAMIDDCPPGRLAPMQLAERTVVGARLADRDGYAVGDAAFAALREHGNPYHLAHGLPDRAGYLTRLCGTAAAGTAISEGPRHRRALALPATAGPGRRPGLHRTADRGPVVTTPGPEESTTARDR